MAGILVGYGTQLGNGCTSGHGVCGIGSLRFRSLVATCTFMFSGVLTAVFSASSHLSAFENTLPFDFSSLFSFSCVLVLIAYSFLCYRYLISVLKCVRYATSYICCTILHFTRLEFILDTTISTIIYLFFFVPGIAFLFCNS